MILDPSRPRRALTRRVLLLVLVPGVAALTALAMLRPAAKAQSAPVPNAAMLPLPTAPHAAPRAIATVSRALAAPKTKPPAVTPTQVPATVRVQASRTVLVRMPPAKPAVPRAAQLPHKGGPDYVSRIYRFPVLTSSDTPPPMLSVDNLKVNGVSLLAGVTDADNPGSPWWDLGGKPETTPVYDTAAYKAEQHPSGRADRRTVLFAFRLPASAQDVTVQYELPQSLGSSSDGFWPTKIAENAHRTEAQLFSRTNGSRIVTAEFPASLSKTSIRVGVATGPWKLAASYAPIPGGFGNIDVMGNAKFLFSPVSETKDGTIQSIATDATEDLRVVAVDKQGKETLPLLAGGNSAGGLDQITARFGLPLAQIKEIRVETRPFQWIEFRNIPLQPTR